MELEIEKFLRSELTNEYIKDFYSNGSFNFYFTVYR